MTERMLGRLVRSRHSGVTGRVIGIVNWLDQPPSLVVQPPVRPDQTVPPTTYVLQASAEVLPEPNDPGRVQ